MKKLDKNILEEIKNNLDKLEVFINKGNPYHDKLGKFTWSPFGKYSGDPYKAESIYGKEYNKLVKEYDLSQLTPEEYGMVLDYIKSPTVGNSGHKNGDYQKVTMFYDKDGKELTPEQIKEASEMYDTMEHYFDKVKDNGERYTFEDVAELRREFSEKYIADKDSYIPKPVLNVLKEEILSKPDFMLTRNEMIELAEGQLPEAFSRSAIEQMDKSDIWNIAKKEGYSLRGESRTLYDELNQEQKRAASYLAQDIESEREIEQRKSWFKDNPEKLQEYIDHNKDFYEGTKITENRIKYDDPSNYLSTKVPNSDKVISGISMQEIASWSEGKIAKYIELCTKADRMTTVKLLEAELKGRALDKLIDEKGVSFDKDIVVTRRVSNTDVIDSDIRKYGFTIQSGFTSTTSANNIAKKSPGGMVFGDNVMKIVIPAGTKVFPVETVAKKALAEDSDMSAMVRQHELLLPSNTKFITLDQSNKKEITDMGKNKEKYSPTLQLEKIDTSYNLKSGKFANTLSGYIAITDQYQKSK